MAAGGVPVVGAPWPGAAGVAVAGAACAAGFAGAGCGVWANRGNAAKVEAVKIEQRRRFIGGNSAGFEGKFVSTAEGCVSTGQVPA